MKYFLIAGEISGDQHAAKLMLALQKKDAEAEFAFLGGDSMESVGGRAEVHIRDMAFMGFTQILSKLGQIRRNFKNAKAGILDFRPDILILVDYGGFNLRMAKWAHNQNIVTHYYIPPKVWAWNSGRVKKIKAYVDYVYTTLPFENDFYAKSGVNCEYGGNPVLEDLQGVSKNSISQRQDDKIVALLPGSRSQEITRVLPVMLSVVNEFSDYKFVIAGITSHKNLYDQIIEKSPNVEVVFDQTRELLGKSIAALVTSGTATLETALMDVPQLVCYKTNPLSYHIAKLLIKVSYISLVNLILDGPAVPEQIQGSCKTEFLVSNLKMILPGGENYEAQLDICRQLKILLGERSCSDYVSGLIINSLNG